jgi:RNA polymerase sigma factor (sigma-70 family)
MDDIELARRAAAGERGAFATLYDRHERRAYNLCYRITGSPDDAADATQETFLAVLERLPSLAGRDVEFGSYLLSAARNASYDALARRKRTAPAGEIPDSAVPVAGGAAPGAPDEGPLREAHAEAVRAANAMLPARQREALALRELGELSYDQVAEVMGMNRNSVAQLISRARLNLRAGLRRGALVSIPVASADCETALPLLALAQDGELDDERTDWLAEHLVGCRACPVRVEAMAEAGTAYRLWLPLVPGFWLRAKVARAAERAHTRARVSRRWRLGAAGGAGAVLLVGAGLATADVVHAPVRVFQAAATAAPAPPVTHPRPARVIVKYRPRVVRHRATRIVAATPPRAVPAAEPVALEAAAAPEPRVRQREAPKPKPKPKPHATPPPAPEPSAEPADVVPPPDPPPADDPRPVDPPDPVCPSVPTAAPVPGCPPPPQPPKPPTGPPNGPIIVAP